jgi:hypothetical protein
MDACSFQCETRIRVTKKKTAHIQAVHGELCISAASGRSPYHRALQAGWSRFRAVLMLTAFYISGRSCEMARKFC